MKNQNAGKMKINSIGTVKRLETKNILTIDSEFSAGLKQLDKFSHLIVLWWADGCDSPDFRSQLQTHPPYAEEYLTGVFACRSPFRPNPIALSICTITSVDEELDEITISEIDAHDGTAILDLKAYFPVCDRVKNAKIPDWLNEWPEWYPDQGIGIME